MVNDNKGTYDFKPNDYVVYPTHGVGRVISIEEIKLPERKLNL